MEFGEGIFGRLWLFTGGLRLFVAHLWSFAGDLWSFAGNLWSFAGDLWLFAGGFGLRSSECSGGYFLVGLWVERNYVWCLIIVVIFVGLGGAKS